MMPEGLLSKGRNRLTDGTTAGTAGVDRSVVMAAVLTGAVLSIVIARVAPADRLLLFALGIGLGLSLFQAAFGFSAGWRRTLAQRRTVGLRAQLLLLALTTTGCVPLLVAHAGVHGAVAPVGVHLIAGAFLFGVGMQLGGGCGSGTLFLTGGGKPRMALVLIAFIAGSVVGSLHLPWWLERPGLPSVSLIAEVGALPALALQLTTLGAFGLGLAAWERRCHGEAEPLLRPRVRGGWHKALRKGEWPFLWGALALALLALAVLWVSGSPWGITFGFALWGVEALGSLGFDLSEFEYWQWPYPRRGLAEGVWGQSTSVTNLGLLVGACLAAGLAHRFRGNAAQWPGLGASASAIAAGLAMGYGARLAFGCNIGAMVGGIASASLHGWVWFGTAFLGFAITARLRRPRRCR